MIAENIWNEEHGIPTRYEIARDLLEMPAKIAKAEAVLHSTKQGVVWTKDRLADVEADLLTGMDPAGAPLIDGKNEAVRAAKLLLSTEAEREAVRIAEKACMEAERMYALTVNHFRALRAVAALIAGEDR